MSVVAIRPIRATIEGASVPGALASLKTTRDAPWTGYIVLRQPPEDGDVVPVIDQFQDKGRWRAAVRKKEDTTLGAGDGYIEQPPLLGVRMPFRRRKNKIEKWIVGELRGEPMFSRGESEHHDVIGLKPFRGVHGHVGEAEAWILFWQTGHVRWPCVPVPAQQQDGRCPVILASVDSNLVERLPQQRDPPFGKTDMHTRSAP